MTNYDELKERNYERNLEILINDVEDQDLDRLIIQLQYMKAKRKRAFESRREYGFCDKCQLTFPAIYGTCTKCEKALRILPIRAEFNYLLDGEPNKEDGGKHFVTVRE
jgi:hypothetical protein